MDEDKQEKKQQTQLERQSESLSCLVIAAVIGIVVINVLGLGDLGWALWWFIGALIFLGTVCE